jgi:hypothetical protein
MAQKVNIIVLCDFHIAAGDDSVEGEEISVALAGGKAAPIAMCDEHKQQHYDQLAEVYYSVSGSRRPAGKKAASSASSASEPVKEQTLKCEHCDETFSTNDGLKRPAMALALHVKKEHPEVADQTTEATNDTTTKPAKKATSSKGRGRKAAEPVPA